MDNTTEIKTIKTDQNRNHLRNNRLFLKIVVIGVLLLTFVVILFTLLPNTQNRSQNIEKTRKTSIAPTITNSVISKIPFANYFVQRTTNGNRQEIIEINDSNTTMARWGNYIFYSQKYVDDGVLTINLYDIKTGITKTIFKKHCNYNMSDLSILNNTLYFSIGEYLQKGETYFVDLNDKDLRVLKLIDLSGEIKNINGHDFFVYGEGDACWSIADYYLINLNTKKLTHIAATEEGCGEGGEQNIAITKDYMILSQHGDNEKEISADIYLNLFTIPFEDPSKKNYLLTNAQMPKNIYNILYLEDRNEIILSGNEVYIFSLADKTLNKIMDIPEEFRKMEYWESPPIANIEKNEICLEKEKNNATHRIKINLVTKTIKKNVTECPHEYDGMNAHNKTIQEIFADLKLPSEFSLVKK